MEVVPGLEWVDRIWDTKVYVLLEGERVVLVDAATPGRAGAVWHYLAAMGCPAQAVDEIWLTHGDLDHMGSVAALKAGSGARVVAHRADAPLVEGRADRELGSMPMSGVYQRVLGWAVRRLVRYQPVTVDRLVEDGDDLGGWRVVHAPGHTAGSVCFYDARRGIILVGDALNHRRGRLGAPPPLFTPDMAQAHTSIRKIATLDFEVCCFGHGPPLTEHAMQRVRAYAGSLPSTGE
jgi:glyoxylase-like metal-dependent hydrolase (beta-lactamase superfamily II)